MTEPVEVKIKAQNIAVTIPNARNKYIALRNVYKLIDEAYSEGLKRKVLLKLLSNDEKDNK